MTATFRAGWTPVALDPSAQAQVAFLFNSDVSVAIRTIDYWLSSTNPPATLRPSVWDAAITAAPVYDGGNFSTSGAPTNAWFPMAVSPPNVPANTDYLAAVLVASSAGCGYDPDDLDVNPIVSADGHITIPVDGGRFHTGSSFVFPDQHWSPPRGMHGVRITYDLAGTTYTVSGSAALTTAASGAVRLIARVTGSAALVTTAIAGRGRPGRLATVGSTAGLATVTAAAGISTAAQP